jgi:hypothetical protein
MTLDFDIEGRVRERLVQGFQCWDLDTLGSPRKGRTAVRAEAVAGVKPLQFRSSLLSYRPGAIGRPVDDGVMNDDDRALGAGVYVAFHNPAAQRKPFAESLDRVFGYDLRPAAVREVDRPAVRSRRLRRRGALRRTPPGRSDHQATGQRTKQE